MYAVKQTKTTLILGVLLAIIVIAMVTLELRKTPKGLEPANTEEVNVLPVAKKALSILTQIVQFN